jgi:hypothetical protein
MDTTVNDQTTGREPDTRGGSLIRDAKTRRRHNIELAIADTTDLTFGGVGNLDDVIDRIDAAQQAYDAEITQITASYPPSDQTDELPKPDHHSAWLDLLTRHTKQLRDAIHGLPPEPGDSYLIAQMTHFEPALVAAAVDLIGRARAHGDGQPRYTGPLTLHVDQVDVGWLLLNASNEQTWHPVTAVLDCEEDSHDDGEGCVVLVSTAYRAGEAHMNTDATVDVRIPAVSS